MVGFGGRIKIVGVGEGSLGDGFLRSFFGFH